MKRRIGCVAAVVYVLFFATVAFAQDNETCLTCHGDPQLSLTLKNGEPFSLYVDSGHFSVSVHGGVLGCVDCHSGISLDKHPTGSFGFKSRRDYTVAMYETCKKCHFSNYTKLLESVHYEMLAKGRANAPTCVNCHGYHDIKKPFAPRQAISQKCAQCHREVYEEYAASVHGKALIEENNQDVPVCTDCHRSHNIEDPRTMKFALKSPDLCGNCHANEKLMKKYGLSTDVLKTYLNDFHGMSIQFYLKEKNRGAAPITAVCTDCHGVHDIMKTDTPDSNVMREKLLKACQKCHPEATENFPAFWLSHYEPSLSKAPLVYFVKLFYWIFIPFVVVGLILHILLHIWRIIINR